MKKALIVARWEYWEKVKTKTFLISLIITPIIIIVFAIMPTLLTSQLDNTTKAVGVIDTSGIYFKALKSNLENFKLSDGQPNFILINMNNKEENITSIIRHADAYSLSGKIEGYLFISNGGTDSIRVEYRSKNSSDFRDINRFEEAFNNARIKIILEHNKVDPSIMKYIANNVQIKLFKINQSGSEEKSGFLFMFFTSFIFILLLMMMILSSGGMLIRSLVEEKSNRLIEILVSSCTPNELLAGKVLGLSSIGLTQVLIWLLIGAVLLGTSIVPADTFRNIIPVMFYFSLGFIFYSSIFVGVGSIVTTEQEAQQITSYLSMVIILPIVIAVPAIENPNSVLVHVFSYIPFTIPAIMILRYNIGPVPLWETLVSMLLMIASIYLSVSIAAKIFRIGILSYGKRPSLKELITWITEK